MENKFILGDCMDKETGLPSYPDNHFDLAIVDPPYGIGQDGGKSMGLRKKWGKSYQSTKHLQKKWDNLIPTSYYFSELQRVSVNWIIWGGNYFISMLERVEHVLIWDKCCEGTSFSHFEIALTSFSRANRKISCPIQRESQRRIHPTQKPVFIYEQVLENYANPGDKILDTHVGSASSLIACESRGFNYVGFELDPDYYAAAKNRMSKGIQKDIFSH